MIVAAGIFLITVFPRLRVSASQSGRALLVGALLVSAYVLVRYWRSLKGQVSKVRLALVGLRGLVLVLMACALSGVQVEYETTMRARVLLTQRRASDARAESAIFKASGSERVALQVVAALQKKDVEVVTEDALHDVDTRSRSEGFGAAVLVTDGAMSGSDARREIEKMSTRMGGSPVYVVADAGESEGASVALENLTVLGRAVRGVPVAVRCMVHARGMQGRESLITISDDAKVQTSARVSWTSDDERQAVMLSVTPKVAGWIDYSAKVEAAGGREETARLSRAFTLYVEERRQRVLFFEGEPTWESKFIRRALEQSGLFDVDYFAQVSRAAVVGTSQTKGAERNQEESDEVQDMKAASAPETKLHAALQSATALNAYDAVIIGATPDALLSSSESAHLSAWVERRGGGLIVLGGNSFNGSIAAPGGKIYTLLPTEISAQNFASQAQDISQGRPLEAEAARGNIFLTPTEEGASALGGYLSASEESGTKTITLTGQGFRLGVLRPGATILAVAGQPGATGTSETGATLIAGRRYGAGRTLVFAPSDSWRIRTSASGEEDRAGGAFGALWQGIVLWASAGARSNVEIVLNDESPAEGSWVTTEIRVRDSSFAPLKIERLSVRLQPLTEDTGDASEVNNVTLQEIAFAPDEADASIWRAHLHLSARGRYALEADYVAGGKTGSVEKQFAVVARTPEEWGASLDTLRRVSRETGGDMIAANEIDALAERLSADSSHKETVRRTWELRRWWPLAFIIPLLLSTEWFLRRWWRVD